MEMLHIRLPIKLRNELKAHCALNRLSMTSLIGELVEKYLRENKEA